MIIILLISIILLVIGVCLAVVAFWTAIVEWRLHSKQVRLFGLWKPSSGGIVLAAIACLVGSGMLLTFITRILLWYLG